MAQLTRGSRMVEILKQGQYSPVPVEKQVLIIYAGTQGVLDDLPLHQIKAFEQDLYHFAENAHPGLLPEIREKKTLTDEIKAQLNSMIAEFKQQFVKDHGTK
jgi:F-type H+-transporting ATPase subunit alpha